MNLNKLAWVAMLVNTIDVLICIIIVAILAKRNRDDETTGVSVKTTSIDTQETLIDSLQEELNATKAGYNAIKKENLELKNKLIANETESEKVVSKYLAIEQDFKKNSEAWRILKTKGAKPDDFGRQIERLKKEIEGHKEAITRLKKDDEEKLSRMQDELKHVKESLLAAEKHAQESKREEADLNNELSKQKKLFDSCRGELDKLVKESLVSKDKLLNKEAEINDMAAKYSEIEKDFKRHAEELQSLKTKGAKSEDLGAQVEKFKKEIGANNSALAKLKKEADEKEKRALLLQEELKASKGGQEEVKALKKENSDFKDRLVRKEEELKEALSKYSPIEKEFKRVSEELKLFKTKNVKLSDFNAQSEQLKKEIETLNNSVAGLKNKDSDNTKQISSLQEELKASQDSYSVARSELKEVSEQALNFSKELIKQKGLLEANNAELEQLRKETPELKEKLVNKTAELHNILSDYSLLEKDFEKVSEEVEALKIENAELSFSQAQAQEAKNKVDEKDNLSPEFKRQEEKSAEISEEQKEKFFAGLRSKSRQKYLQIGEIMLEQNAVTRQALAETFEYQEKYGGSIAMYLINHAHIDELKLAQTICHQFGVPYLPLSSYDVSAEIIKLVPMDIAEKYWLIPLQKSGNSLSLAMMDPFDFYAIDTVEKKTGYKVQAFVGVLSDIIQAMENYYKIVVKGTDYKGQRATPIFITTEVYKGIERRQAPRFNIKLDAFFPYKGGYRKSSTKDVCVGGFLLDSDVALEAGLVISLQVDLPKEISLWPILAVIQVLRVNSTEEGRFNVAVKTIKISKEEIDMIIKYALEHKEQID